MSKIKSEIQDNGNRYSAMSLRVPNSGAQSPLRMPVSYSTSNPDNSRAGKESRIMQKNNGKYSAAHADTLRKAGDGNGGLRKTVLMVVLVLLLLFCARTRPGLCAEIVAGPILQRTGDTMMTMLWETDKLSRGEVTYGRPSEKECTSVSTAPGTYHIVALTNLEPGQEYEYSITEGAQRSIARAFTPYPQTALTGRY